MEEIRTLEDANSALAEICDLQRRSDFIINDLNETIDVLKAHAEEKIEPIKTRLKDLEKGLKTYAEFNRRDLFNGKKSIELNFGTLSFRKVTMLRLLNRSWNWGKVVECLKQTGLTEALLITEKPHKEVLRQWSPEKLKNYGCKLTETEKFRYEIKEEKMQ